MEGLGSFFVLGIALVIIFDQVTAAVHELTISECMPQDQEIGRIQSVSITPYPIELPGNGSVSASVQLFKPVSGRIRMELSVKRKLGSLGYIFPIPCVHNVGSCTYHDVCSMLASSTPHVQQRDITDWYLSQRKIYEIANIWKREMTTTDIPLRTTTDIPLGATTDIPLGTTTDIPLGTTTDIPMGTTTDIPLGSTRAMNSTATNSTATKSTCPKIMSDNNIPCTCPYNAGLYSVHSVPFHIPDLGTLSALAKGDYQVNVAFYDENSGEMLMCQNMQFSLTTSAECTGLACIIG